MLANCSDAEYDPNKLSWGLCKLSTHIKSGHLGGEEEGFVCVFFLLQGINRQINNLPCDPCFKAAQIHSCCVFQSPIQSQRQARGAAIHLFYCSAMSKQAQMS